MLKRACDEQRRYTRMVRIFPNAVSGLGLIRAPCVEAHGSSIEDKPYLNMDLLREVRKNTLQERLTFTP
jgi:putative transposase